MGWKPSHRKKARPQFRSEAHLAHVRNRPCCICGTWPSQACHYRIGTDGGLSVKPSDYWVTNLCARCHDLQHKGERTFWQDKDPQAIMGELIRTSPVRREIEAHRDKS